jgi:hypothetical protein
MNKLIPLILPLLFATSLAKAAIVTFTGGTATLENGESSSLIHNL